MKISVLTPTFRCGRFLEQCIRSVLDQNWPDFEHVVVDGGSDDGTVEILRKYAHLRWISERDDGEGYALNKGLRMLTGDAVVWLNADDFLMPGTFRTVVAEMAPGRDIVYGNAHLLNGKDALIAVARPIRPVTMSRLLRWYNLHISQPTIFFARHVIDALGPFKESLFYGLDYEYWLRATARGFRWHYVDRTFACARVFRDGAKSGRHLTACIQACYRLGAVYRNRLGRGEHVRFLLDDGLYRLRGALKARPRLNHVFRAIGRRLGLGPEWMERMQPGYWVWQGENFKALADRSR